LPIARPTAGTFSRVLLDFGFNVAGNLIDREARLLLARRIFDECLQEGTCMRRELEHLEVVPHQPIVILIRHDICALERVHAHVKEPPRIDRDVEIRHQEFIKTLGSQALWLQFMVVP
jgi:hypothetical protein